MRTPQDRYEVRRGLVDELVRAATARRPAEVCGLLFGRRPEGDAPGLVTEFRSAENRAGSSSGASFHLNAADVREAWKSGGDPCIGYFHSHPSGRAVPSQADRRGASPGAVAMIVGLGDGGHPELRLYEVVPSGEDHRWEPVWEGTA